MKFILTFIFCSGLANQCLPPMEYEESYSDLYTCLHAGYELSYSTGGKHWLAKPEQNIKVKINFIDNPI